MQTKIIFFLASLIVCSTSMAADPFCRFSFKEKNDLYIKIKNEHVAYLMDALDKKICSYSIVSIKKENSREIIFYNVSLFSIDCQFKKNIVKSIRLRLYPTHSEISYSDVSLQNCDETKGLYKIFNQTSPKKSM